jgi:peptidoglycan/xylan/chitin deacetylase (PgdA/CDA1 family)
MRSPDYISAPRDPQRGRRWRRGRIGAIGAALVVAAGLVAAVELLGGSGRLLGTARSQARPAVSRPLPQAVPPPPPLRQSAVLAALDARGSARIRALARLGKPLYCGGRRGNAVAFTFDDGPGPYTAVALRKLRQAHQRATFFDVGNSMNYFPGYAPRERTVAAIGDHTYTHPDLAWLSQAQIYTQIHSDRLQIQRQSGQAVNLFRPPYGAFNATVLRVARRLGLLTVLWTADSQDSLGANYTRIIKNVEAALRPGAIILMHENRGQTIRALTTLLPALRRRHLRSVSLLELLATDPPSVAQLKKGPSACGGPDQRRLRDGH